MNPTRLELYDGLSEVLTYPGQDYLGSVGRCAALLRRAHPGVEGTYSEFAQRLEGKAAWELEELFTRTFDLNPACCLEIGWHLFGENYERGRLLVKMRQELSRVGLQESAELPDHLTHVLRALSRMEDQRAAGLVSDGVLPAVGKMLGALEGKDNPFEGLLKTIQILLRDSLPNEEEVSDD